MHDIVFDICIYASVSIIGPARFVRLLCVFIATESLADKTCAHTTLITSSTHRCKNVRFSSALIYETLHFHSIENNITRGPASDKDACGGRCTAMQQLSRIALGMGRLNQMIVTTPRCRDVCLQSGSSLTLRAVR